MKTLFSEDYFSARERLLNSCQQAGETVESFLHPSYHDSHGDVAIDVVRFGNQKAAKVLFITSGIHGTEGTVGSAIQLGLVEQLQTLSLPADTALVLVHAVNPVGFIKLTRGNENNVDLNRNFKDFSQPVPDNEEYRLLHGALCSGEWQGEQRQQDDQTIEQFISDKGFSALTEKVLAGQHSHPDGIFFGGHQREWSNKMMHEIVQNYVGNCDAVGIIDIHTGLGDKGVGLVLRDQQLIPTQDGIKPLTGQMCSVLDDLVQPSKKIKIIMEYGTLGFRDVLKALRDDNWLSRHPEAPQDVHQKIKHQLKNALCVDEDDWYQAVWEQGHQLVQDVIDELHDD